MQGEAQRQRSRERLLRLVQAPLDPDELRLEVVVELRRAIGFAHWCWALVDPASLISTGGMSEQLPFGPDFARYITLVERVADVNSYRALMCHWPSVGLLSVSTGGQLWRSVRHREVHALVGIGDELRAVLRDGRGCWGFLNLYRATGERPFDPEEGQLVAELVPALAVALRRSLQRAPSQGDGGAAPPGVLILDDELRLHSQTPAARQWLAALAPAGAAGAGPPLPTAVYAVAARLLGQEAGVDPHRTARSRSGDCRDRRGSPPSRDPRPAQPGLGALPPRAGAPGASPGRSGYGADRRAVVHQPAHGAGPPQGHLREGWGAQSAGAGRRSGRRWPRLTSDHATGHHGAAGGSAPCSSCVPAIVHSAAPCSALPPRKLVGAPDAGPAPGQARRGAADRTTWVLPLCSAGVGAPVGMSLSVSAIVAPN